MDDRGRIACFETDEDADAAGYTEWLTDDEAAYLQTVLPAGPSRDLRRAALARYRMGKWLEAIGVQREGDPQAAADRAIREAIGRDVTRRQG